MDDTQAAKHAHQRIDTPIATPPPTPSPAAVQAHTLYREIRDIHEKLAPLEDLSPCDTVNTLLTRLVTLCIQPYPTDLISHFFLTDGIHPLCASLQRLCSAAESALEHHWATRILADAEKTSDPTRAQTLLHQFPYYKNYISLTHLEASLLLPFLPPPTPTSSPLRIAFLGSGPLPLSSLLLPTHFPTAHIYNLDRDAAALSLSARLTRALGLASRQTFSCEDATRVGSPEVCEAVPWGRLDVVFLAALVGMGSAEKVGVLRELAGRLREGCVVVVRSARGVRGVVYPVLEVSEELVGAGYEVLVEMHPWTEVVNSVVVLRVKRRG